MEYVSENLVRPGAPEQDYPLETWVQTENPTVRRDYHQSFVQPDLRAEMKGFLWRVSAWCPVFKAEKGPPKSVPNPGLPVIHA